MLNICTSSIIYTLYLPFCGGIFTWSVRFLISSTELFEAASNSTILNDADELNDLQLSHSLQASYCSVRFVQLIVFASIRAQVVFPTPRGPQKRKACANWLFFIAF